ncbi:p2 protein [Blackberry chlorotic ringspot virus]|uniref:RNA-directed RNA polymerase 2a n=1 Tax=Blackberry chlorotic ringspot virus TaxID=339420 RepID=Q2QF34_9BROM|nr:p2 protein [Blackberry chlorotic ringspot virus]AAZ42392.2 p2 protein [Blackberry chlorotic ringspot virus]
MDYVKENLIVYSLRSRLEFIQSFGVEPDMYKEWVSMFLFKFIVEHTAKFDFATIDCTFGMIVARLIPGYSDLDDEDEEHSPREIDSFYLPYDDLDVDYTTIDYRRDDVEVPTNEVLNLVSNASYVPEGVSWGDVTDSSFEDHLEEIQELPTFNVDEPVVSSSEAGLPDDDGTIQDVVWVDQSDPIVSDVVADADLRNCGFVDYQSGSIKTSKWKPKVIQVRPDPSIIQNAVDEIFPNHHHVDDKFFQEWVETHDIDLEVTNCDLDMSVFNDWTKGSDSRLMPAFSVGGLSHTVPTQRETLLAVKKRNMNVPELQSQFDHNDVLNRCVNRFLTHVVDKTRLSKLMPISGEEVHYFNQYVENKNPPLSEYKGPIPLVALDKYMHMIKTTLKPVEEDSLHVERPIPATITYHKKGVVMMTSPYFLCAMVRLLYVLKSKFVVPTGKYHQIFHMDPERLEVSNFFKEIDFSKFDKSQGRLHHDVQFKLFLMLGIPEHFVTSWFNAHELSHIRDRDCGVGFSVDYQRRTGDACTYLGNTLVTLSVLSYVYDLSNPNISFVAASGDDSLIGSLQPLPRDKEDLCVSLFNFETKFPHNQPFICSKFLLVVECDDGTKEVLAVPNPLKLLQKLGPKTMQVTMIDDYYQSLCDILWVFEDADVCRRVAELAEFRAFKGRKKCLFLESALLSLPSLVANRLKFLRRTINLESSKACIRNDVYSNLVDALEPMCARRLDASPRRSEICSGNEKVRIGSRNSRCGSWRKEYRAGDKIETPRICEGVHGRGKREPSANPQRISFRGKELTWKGGNKLP